MVMKREKKLLALLLAVSLTAAMFPIEGLQVYAKETQQAEVVETEETDEAEKPAESEAIDVVEESSIENDESAELQTGETTEEVAETDEAPEDRVGVSAGQVPVYKNPQGLNIPGTTLGRCILDETTKTAIMTSCWGNSDDTPETVTVPRTLLVTNLDGEEGPIEVVMDYSNGDTVSDNGYLAEMPTVSENYMGPVYTVTTISENCFDDNTTTKTINLPNTITSDITVDFFEDCRDLGSIRVIRKQGEDEFGRYYDGTTVDDVDGNHRTLGVLIDLKNASHSVDKEIICCPPKYPFDNYMIKLAYSGGSMSIGERAFQNCTGLKSVDNASSSYIKEIGKQAFLNCSQLTTASVFDAILTDIGDEAFKGCNRLKTIKINKLTDPSQLQHFGDSVFEGTMIEQLDLPRSVSDVRGKTFYGMNKLQSITVNVDNKHYAAKDGVLYSYDETADGHIGKRMVVLPSANTEAIAENEFTTPYGVTEFDDYAMYNCQNLKTLTFLSDVFTVGTHTMSDNRALRNVYIYSGFPDLQPDVADDPNTTGQFENIFGVDITQAEKNNFRIYCGKGTRAWKFAVDCSYNPIALYDEANYTSISDGAGGRILTGFNYDPQYKEVFIPNFIVTDATTRPTTKSYYTGVGTGVLAKPEITSVWFSVSMSNIDPNAFRIVPDEDDYTKDTNADSLQNIYIEEGNKKLDSVDGVLYKMGYNNRTQSYYIEELLYYPVGRTESTYRTVSSMTYLPQNAFRGAYNLKIVEIYDTIQSIGRISNTESNETAAFAGCKNLIAIDILPNGTTTDDDYICYGSDMGVLYGVDEGVKKTLLYYPKGERIPGDTGHSSGSYEVVDGCQTIHDVKNCIYLTKITIPKSVTTIDDDAFSGSTELKEVIFHETSAANSDQGIQNIGNRAFKNTKLSSVMIPNTIRSIGSEAFYGCSRLNNVTIKADEALTIGEKAFYGNRALNSVKIYGTKNTTRGGDVTIGDNAFSRCTALTTLEATNLTSAAFMTGSFSYNTALTTADFTQTDVSTIGVNAFRGCSVLKKLDLSDGDNLATISNGAFQECTSLESAILPSHLSVIGNSAFENCRHLIELNFDELSLTTIGSRAFRNCGFTVIPFRNGLVNIGDCAFQACTMLTSMYIPETVTNISGNPFYGFGRDLLIYGKSGSGIENFINVVLTGTKPTFIAEDMPLTTVNINQSTATIYDAGNTSVQLTAITQTPENAPVIWKSLDPDIAYVNSTTGLVTAGSKTGTTVVRAICTTNGAYASCIVDVVETKVIIPEESILLNKNGNNRKKNINASSVPLRIITYKSADKRIAAVDRSGNVTAKKVGTTTITAMSGSKEDGTYREATVNVTVLKASTKLDKKKITLNNKGDEENLTSELTATHAGAEETVVWKSSNPRVVAIPEPDTVTKQTTGDTITITALRAGSATITATCNGVKATCRVTVKPVTTKLNYTTLTLYAGGDKVETKRLKVKTTGINKDVEWSSDHDEFATVDDRGYVTALSRGNATITATCNGVSATCLVRVLDSTVTLKSGVDANYDLTKGIVLNSRGDNQYPLKATVVGRNSKVKWVSTAKDVVTVNSKGILTGKAYGEAEIIATANGVDTSCTVTVMDTRTELDYSNLTIHLKSDSLTSQTLTVNIEGADYNKNLKWWSSNPDIVEIERSDALANGNATVYTGTGTAYVTARKKGKATIYVMANGVQSKCVITVKDD